MNFFKTISAIVASLPVILSLVSCDRDVRTAEALAERVMGAKSSSVRFERLKNDNTDVYELETVRGKVTVRGNNANSMAVGLNRYIQEYCLAQVNWYDYNPVELPDTMPTVPEKVKVKSLVPMRFFLNYCTYGYTMPFWDWKQWERFIDWMALNGVNMPLALTGQEAVWQKVYRSCGMSDEQIRSFFAGPAHLPWQRMCNMDRWQGPLPQGWIDAQAGLQKQILKRERELNMRPVLPGFSGHIPEELSGVLGERLDTSRVSCWCGFEDTCRCTFLDPGDPHFAVIQKTFIEEQTRMYGTDHIYSVDSFNEVDLPSWEPKYLAAISKGIYESMAAADKDAVWLQMGWLFQSFNWNQETIKAYLTAVPKGHLIMLDYVCDYRPFWKETESFYGQDFIWCYLGNFGGMTVIEGNMHHNEAALDDAFAHAGPSFKGIGSTLEGFGVNEPVYEHIMSRSWNTGRDVDTYIDNIADRHLGRVDTTFRAFWHYMDEYVSRPHHETDAANPLKVRPCFHYNGNWTCDIRSNTAQELENAGRIIDRVKGTSDRFTFDRANVQRQILCNRAEPLLNRFTDAYEAGDRAAMTEVRDIYMSLFDSLTAVLRTRPEFSLDKWVEDAARWGSTPGEKDYYRKNARTIITVWSNTPVLLDYALRDYDGLMEGYYKVRWRMFFDAVFKSFDSSLPFDGIDDELWDFECRYSGNRQ